jgi:TolB-like protein
LEAAFRVASHWIDEGKLPLGPDSVREQLGRILGSADFDASKRNRRFLEYAVEEALAGRADRIKAYNIATAVFGRDVNFDPQLDSIVRIEAGRLRRSLERYYLTAGSKDPIRITVPTGSYVPVFNATRFLAPAVGSSASGSASGSRRRYQNGRTIFVKAFEEDGDQSACPNLTRGFTRQLIVGLTRFTDLFVFGAETTFSYGGAVQPEQLRTDLDPDFLLEGGTTVSADRFSVAALLVDARSGRILWADSFERSLQAKELVRVRDEVANSIARTLAQPYGVIFNNVARDTDGTLPDNFISYDWVIRFYQYCRSYERALFEPVRAGLEQAIVSDPCYAEAFACLSRAYTNAFRFGHDVSGVTADPLQRALALARSAIELAPNGSRGHHALALAYWFAGDAPGSIAVLETSRALNPNDTDIMADLGLRYAMLTEWEKAMPLLEESFARNPAEPSLYRSGLFLYHYAHGHYEEALAEARRIETPNVVYGFVGVAMAAGQLGLRQEAEAALKSILMIDPNYGDHVVDDLTARTLHPDLVRIGVEGLRKAGLSCSKTGSGDGPGPASNAVQLRRPGLR